MIKSLFHGKLYTLCRVLSCVFPCNINLLHGGNFMMGYPSMVSYTHCAECLVVFFSVISIFCMEETS